MNRKEEELGEVRGQELRAPKPEKGKGLGGWEGDPPQPESISQTQSSFHQSAHR